MFLLSLIVGGFTLILVWLILSAEMAVALWTPLRGWLGIPEPRATKPRADHSERARHIELMDQEIDLELVDQTLEPVEP